jgi:DNA replication and repair protein RecF
MLLRSVELRDFRSYEQAAAEIGDRLTVVHGPNGAGKSNLLEAICFGCTSRSPRTRNDRELIRFGAQAARVTLHLLDDRDVEHMLSVGFGAIEQRGLQKRIRFDGAPIERIDDAPARPLVAVFVPDRLELINGPPAVRRGHLDHLLAALWPGRAVHRPEYARALAQRNALISRLRAGIATRAALETWNIELARAALALIADRAAAIARVADGFAARCAALGLTGAAKLEYRPRSGAGSVEQFVEELDQRLDADLERGYSTHGPHRDEVALLRDRRHLRTYGSQGERRLALLALLLSERAALGEERGQAPLMLLDDVMSELDEDRRALLLADLSATQGQSVIATTDLAHVPLPDASGTARLRIVASKITAERLT